MKNFNSILYTRAYKRRVSSFLSSEEFIGVSKALRNKNQRSVKTEGTRKQKEPYFTAGLIYHSKESTHKVNQPRLLVKRVLKLEFLIILRKEVIQPQVPLRLPCYDLVPIAKFIFGA